MLFFLQLVYEYFVSFVLSVSCSKIMYRPKIVQNVGKETYSPCVHNRDLFFIVWERLIAGNWSCCYVAMETLCGDFLR